MNRKDVIAGLEYCTRRGFNCRENKDCPYSFESDHCHCIEHLMVDTLALLKVQEATINDIYTRYEGLCKEIREKYESDDVCGLCQYDGAYVGESGDWMNECPGFETNECFCMKNSIRKMCAQPLIEEP